MSDLVQYKVELFHGLSGLRNYQAAGIVECKPGILCRSRSFWVV